MPTLKSTGTQHKGTTMSSMRDYGKQCRIKHEYERRAHLNALALKDVFVTLTAIATCVVALGFIAHQIVT